MAEPLAATPGSTAESNTPVKQSAAKDRPCPYCHANFTSSSLGRHLDVYIKAKNPKPPDGIHDVDEIRRQRGNITRRQARTSSAKREGSTTSSVKPAIAHDQRSPSVAQRFTNGDLVNKVPTIISLNAPSWEATGVMNDIPSVSSGGRPEAKRDQLRRSSHKNEAILRKKLNEEREKGRAVELALREVLDSLKAASSQSSRPSPFQFDFFGQTFPNLCFRCLVPPPTLSSNYIVPSETSWSVDSPGATHYQVLRRRVDMQLRYWKKSILAAADPADSNGTVAPTRVADINIEDDESCKPYLDHLDNTFQTWIRLDETQKAKVWHLEALRAFVREQTEHGETHVKMEHLEQENANLRLQITRLNECQQPREFTFFSPTQLPISRDVAVSLAASEKHNRFDYDEMVRKWKARVLFIRPAQKPLPQGLAALSDTHELNGRPSYDHDQPNGDMDLEADDDDLMDAPGEMDDEVDGVQTRMPAGPMNQGMLDPKLRAPGDDVMHGMENGGNFLGGKLLTELRGYGVQRRM